MEIFLMDAAPGPCNTMQDLETWGTAPGNALRSIGAVMFDPHSNEIGDEFYMNITDESCLKVGLTRDPDTVKWWGRSENVGAASVFAKDPIPLREVGEAFNAWWRKNRSIFVWSQGANFDQPLWEAAMRAVGLGVPWKFWDSRCTRTAYDMGGFNPRSIKRKGIHHYALDDAKHQTLCVQAAYANVRRVP
jgi:hypothetical protein